MENLSENIFRAMDTIVTERLKSLEFDKTVSCTIVETYSDDKTKYFVTDGSSKFYAYALDGNTYKEKQSVLVTIPNGNYENQKTIIGKVDDKMNKLSYIRAKDKFLSVTDNLYPSTQGEKIPNYTTHLLVSFGVKNKKITETKFQYVSKVEILLKDLKDKVYIAEFNSDDFFGNPENFMDSYFTQTKIFDIIYIQEPVTFDGLRVYYKEKIIDPDDEEEATWSEDILISDNDSDNDGDDDFEGFIASSSIDIEAGYLSEDGISEKLQVYCEELSTYSEEQEYEELKRTLKVKWIENFDGKFINIESSDKLGLNTLKWFYQLNQNQDEWTEMPEFENLFTILVPLDLNNNSQRYKAKILNLEGKEIESNTFEFKKSKKIINDLNITLYQQSSGYGTETGEIPLDGRPKLHIFKDGTKKYGSHKSGEGESEDNPTNNIEGTFEERKIKDWISDLNKNNVEGDALDRCFSNLNGFVIDDDSYKDKFYWKISLKDFQGVNKELNIENFSIQSLNDNKEFLTLNLQDNYNYSVEEKEDTAQYYWKVNRNKPEDIVFFYDESEKIIRSEIFPIDIGNIKEKINVYKIIYKFGNTSYEKLFGIGFKKEAWYDCNLNQDTNEIIYDTYGKIKSYLTEEINIKNKTKDNLNVSSLGNNTINPVSVGDDKRLFPSSEIILIEDNAELIKITETVANTDDTGSTEEIIYSCPVIMSQENFVTSDFTEQANFNLLEKNAEKVYQISSAFDIGELKNNMYSGIGLGVVNNESCLYSVKDDQISILVKPGGLTIGNNWELSNNPYHRTTSGGFFGKFPGNLQESFYLSERGIGSAINDIPNRDYVGGSNASQWGTQQTVPWEVVNAPREFTSPYVRQCFVYFRNIFSIFCEKYSKRFDGVWEDDPGGTWVSAESIPAGDLTYSSSSDYYYAKGVPGETAQNHYAYRFRGLMRYFHLYRCSLYQPVIRDPKYYQGSDVSLKMNFRDFDERYEELFNSVKPQIFNYKRTPDLNTYGFIAQDVEKVFNKFDLKNQEVLSQFEGKLALNYTQFIPLNTWQIQKLKQRVTNLEQEVQELKLIIKEKTEK